MTALCNNFLHLTGFPLRSKPAGEKYVMICHEHMETVDEAWHPQLTIAHFFIREVFYWWAAQQNLIIDSWNEKNG